jgi:hypothetical protein
MQKYRGKKGEYVTERIAKHHSGNDFDSRTIERQEENETNEN